MPRLSIAATLILAFVALGVLWGAWQALLPELAASLGLGAGPLGLILTGGFVAAFPAMLASGRLVDRHGVGRVVAVAALAMASAMGIVGIGFEAGALPVAIIATALLTSGSGAFDIGLNAAAANDIEWSRPARLTLLHAGFSGGGATGALGAGVLLDLGLPARVGYLLVAALLVLVAALVLAAPWRRAEPTYGIQPAHASVLIPLALLAGLAFLAEGSMETWAALYLREVTGASALVGALGPAAFHTAMLIGRLIGVGIAGALGAGRTLLTAGGMMAAGMTLALAVTVAGVAIPALAFAALGASFVVPVVVSLTAARSGSEAGRVISNVMTLGYAGFLVGPSLVGLLAESVGLRIALGVVPLAGIGIAVGSRLARRSA